MKALNINTTKETQIFNSENYYTMEDFAKSQDYTGVNDEYFLEDYGVEDLENWSDERRNDWLNDQKNADINSILEDYQSLEINYYISCITNLERWNGKAQTEIQTIQNISDIFSYRGCIELTAIYEGVNYLRFEISHHDGNDTYLLFFNTVEYNETLAEDIEDRITNSLEYHVYKPQDKEYNTMISNIVDKYNQDYINSCVNVKDELKSL